MRDDVDIEMAIDRFGDAVLTACLAYLGNRQSAEDIFQDTFLKYAMHDGPFSDDEHRKAWLLRVAINASKDMLRASSSKNLELNESHDAPDTADFASALAERTRVQHALGYISDNERAAIVLTTIMGYSVPEAAHILKSPQNTVYSHITRGKRKLRKVLENE